MGYNFIVPSLLIDDLPETNLAVAPKANAIVELYSNSFHPRHSSGKSCFRDGHRTYESQTRPNLLLDRG